MVKKKQLEKYSIRLKKNKKYFNYRKKSYYARDYYAQSSNKKKTEKSLKKTKCAY